MVATTNMFTAAKWSGDWGRWIVCLGGYGAWYGGQLIRAGIELRHAAPISKGFGCFLIDFIDSARLAVARTWEDQIKYASAASSSPGIGPNPQIIR